MKVTILFFHVRQRRKHPAVERRAVAEAGGDLQVQRPYGTPIEPWSTSTAKKCWLYRGTTYAAMGRLEEALVDLSRFAKAHQDYPGIEETIEHIKIQLGEL